MQVRFGEFEFDGPARELRLAGAALPLTPKAFELLRALLDSYPRALSKAELHDRLWPDTAVSRASLHQVVTELRRGLGDDARHPRFVRTVFGYGYAFADVPLPVGGGAEPAPVRWALLLGRRDYPLPAGSHLLGRGSECAVVVPSTRASRHHARIEVDEQGVWLEDLGSKNGTFVGGVPVRERRRLQPGDEIRIGSVALSLRALRPDAETETG